MRNILRQFTSRRAHPAIQFVKYVISGGIVTVFGMLIFTVLTWKVFPSLRENELVVRLLDLRVEPMSEALRARNYAFCKTIEFLIANLLCYFINVIWVFERGKHSRRKEIMLFYAVSLLSFTIGTAVGTGLIAFFNAGTVVAYIATSVASILINYAGRKFYVFKG